MLLLLLENEFRKRYLSNQKNPNIFEARAVVFEGPEDYHKRINDEAARLFENKILTLNFGKPLINEYFEEE